MSLNLLHNALSALEEQMPRMTTHFSVEASKVKSVFESLVPALIASLMKKADSPEGAQDLYTAISSSRVDSNIAINLGGAFYSPVAVGNLVKLGGDQVLGLIGDKAPELVHAVAQHTSTPSATVTSLMGIASTTLFGLLKRYLQMHSGQQHVMLSTLEHQVPHIRESLHEGVWSSLGLGDVSTFLSDVEGKLKATLATFKVDAPSHPPRYVPVNKSGGLRRWWWLWLLMSFVLLLLILRSCKNAAPVVPAKVEPPIAAIAPAVPSKAALLSLVTDKEGKATAVATVGSEAEKNSLLEALKKVYGDHAVTADIKVDEATKPADWITKLGELLPNFKLPNADLTLKGSDIQFGGAAADAKLGLLDKIKSLFGTGFNVSMFSMSEALANSKKMFEESLAALKPGACTVADVAKTLNTYSFNFATGSAEIPKEDALLFAKSITAVKACAKDAKLEIGGHTDNVGAADVNMALSQKRADSVRDFFVSKGIAATALTTKAYGETQPMGDNDTASGRFQNRRIEFNEQK